MVKELELRYDVVMVSHPEWAKDAVERQLLYYCDVENDYVDISCHPELGYLTEKYNGITQGALLMDLSFDFPYEDIKHGASVSYTYNSVEELKADTFEIIKVPK